MRGSLGWTEEFICISGRPKGGLLEIRGSLYEKRHGRCGNWQGRGKAGGNKVKDVDAVQPCLEIVEHHVPYTTMTNKMESSDSTPLLSSRPVIQTIDHTSTSFSMKTFVLSTLSTPKRTSYQRFVFCFNFYCQRGWRRKLQTISA